MIPDTCEISDSPALDANGNTVIDTCEVDCNDNAIFDFLDIFSGTSQDNDTNGIPDECECTADIIQNGMVDFSDLITVIGNWGPCDTDCPADIVADGVVGFTDLILVLNNWGTCK